MIILSYPMFDVGQDILKWLHIPHNIRYSILPRRWDYIFPCCELCGINQYYKTTISLLITYQFQLIMLYINHLLYPRLAYAIQTSTWQCSKLSAAIQVLSKRFLLYRISHMPYPIMPSYLAYYKELHEEILDFNINYHYMYRLQELQLFLRCNEVLDQRLERRNCANGNQRLVFFTLFIQKSFKSYFLFFFL